MTSNDGTTSWAEPFVGEWKLEIINAGETVPTMTGVETVRLVGNWLVAEVGGEFQMLTMIGFDPELDRFVGAVAGTMASSLFVMNGTRDDESGVLTLETEGPAITEGKRTDRYRDIWRSTGPDTREIAAEVLEADGSWREFMRYMFRRREA